MRPGPRRSRSRSSALLGLAALALICGARAVAVQSEDETPVDLSAVEIPVTPSDRRLTPDKAYLQLWSAIDREDALAVAKFVPSNKLRKLKTYDAVHADLVGLVVVDLRVVASEYRGNKALVVAHGTSTGMTDRQGRPVSVDVVVRMIREEGVWKVLAQRWLVATPIDATKAEARAWLAAGAGTTDSTAASRP